MNDSHKTALNLLNVNLNVQKRKHRADLLVVQKFIGKNTKNISTA